MKASVFKYCLLILSVFTVVLSHAAVGICGGGEFVRGELLAGIKEGASVSEARSAARAAGAQVIGEIPQIKLLQLKVPENAVDAVREALSRNPNFEYVENNFLARAAAVPNDPSYGEQHWLRRISAPQAWDINTGSQEVIVAVIDTGVDPHPEIAPKLVPGYNCYDENTDTSDKWAPGHGTSVAGIIAASTNDAVGVAGISWASKIMPFAVFDAGGQWSPYGDISEAITYAADWGARIINISIIGYQRSRTLQNAVDYAWGKGAVIFASAGNDSTSDPGYPAACTNVIGVTSQNMSDRLSAYSNYGDWVDVAAPGETIYTIAKGGGYDYFAGTSAASPVAAGVGALVLSANPSLTAQQIVDIVRQNADDLNAPGFDAASGFGRVNAYRSVIAATNIPTTPDTEPPTVSMFNPQPNGYLSETAVITLFDTDNVGAVKAEIYLDGALWTVMTAKPYTFDWDTTTYANGSYTLSAAVYDAAGNVGQTDIVPVSVNNYPDISPPYGSISSPADGSTVTGDVTVTAYYDDDSFLNRIELYIDGVLKTTVYSNNLTYAWNTKKAASGPHTLTTKAFDWVGNMSTFSITVYK